MVMPARPVKFWFSVHKRAVRETRRALDISRERMVIAVLVGGIYLLLVWTQIGKEAGHSETLLRIALSIALILAFPLVYLWKFVKAPATLYGELSAQNEKLQQQIETGKKPPLLLSFVRGQPGFLEETTCGDVQCVYIRVLVKSEVHTSECEGSLTAMYRSESSKWVATKYAESLLLSWATRGYVRLDIHPGHQQFLDVCFITERDKLIVPCVNFVPVRPRDNVADEGTYKLDILVTSRDGAAGALALIIELTDDWRNPKVIPHGRLGPTW